MKCSEVSSVIEQWDFSKNTIDPSATGVKSAKRAQWVCKLGHTWSTIIKYKRGCPYCNDKKLLLGFNDLQTKMPTIAAEYSTKNDLSAREILFSSNTKVWWSCSKGHDYQTEVAKRTKGGRNCPYCSNQTFLEGFNDLKTIRPNLLPYWDYKLNSVLPSQISPRTSNYRIFWRCPTCSHSWQETPHSLTRSNICKKCWNRSVSLMEIDFAELVVSLTEQKIIRNTRKVIPPKELDIYIPSLQKAIEFNGEYWHSSDYAQKSDLWKKKECEILGIDLLVITDKEWENTPKELMKEKMEGFLAH